MHLYRSKSLRLPAFDYATPGAYFITICTQHRMPIFGAIQQGTMQLNEAGSMIVDVWNATFDRFPYAHNDTYILMPNHLHAIVFLGYESDRNGRGVSSSQQEQVALPKLVQWFKSLTTNVYGKRVKENGWPPYSGRLRQQGYYERVIRNEQELDRTREYIENNTQDWDKDEYRIP